MAICGEGFYSGLVDTSARYEQEPSPSRVGRNAPLTSNFVDMCAYICISLVSLALKTSRLCRCNIIEESNQNKDIPYE